MIGTADGEAVKRILAIRVVFLDSAAEGTRPWRRDGDERLGGDGNDEMDPAQGRGWAVVKGDQPHRMIFIHLGDDSEFVAK